MNNNDTDKTKIKRVMISMKTHLKHPTFVAEGVLVGTRTIKKCSNQKDKVKQTNQNEIIQNLKTLIPNTFVWIHSMVNKIRKIMDCLKREECRN